LNIVRHKKTGLELQKLISVAVSEPDLIRSVDTIKDAKITHRKGKFLILHIFEVLDGLLFFPGARKPKEKDIAVTKFQLQFFQYFLIKA
jgi:hypothetical protein